MFVTSVKSVRLAPEVTTSNSVPGILYNVLLKSTDPVIMSLKPANFFSDSDIIKRARRKAFEIIDKDSKLIASENVLIKKEFLINYKDMFEFININ